MNPTEKAMVMLEILDSKGAVNINWNFENQWLDAIKAGLLAIEQRETREAATPQESSK